MARFVATNVVVRCCGERAGGGGGSQWGEEGVEMKGGREERLAGVAAVCFVMHSGDR